MQSYARKKQQTLLAIEAVIERQKRRYSQWRGVVTTQFTQLIPEIFRDLFTNSNSKDTYEDISV